MKATAEARKGISLARSLLYCSISKTAWYYTKRPRNVATDHLMETKIMEIAEKRPTYGTRRMAAQLARQSGLPVNRKKVARIYQKLGWSTPGRRKSEIIRSNKKVPKPTAPNQFWEADMSYIWCGRDGWCYSFNVIDVFTRQWLGFAFDTRATRHAAIMSINNAVASRKPDPGRLTIRVDNGSQYTSRDFRGSVDVLGARLEYIYVNTPQQNGHIEPFHKTLKKEYVWPHEFGDAGQAEVALLGALEDYNRHRIHSAIGYMTPDEFAARWEETKTKEVANR